LVRLVCPDATAPKIVVDIRKTEPGRGAWLHQSLSCFELAVRRRAFYRAFRVQNADLTAAQSYFREKFKEYDKQMKESNKEMATR